MVAITFNAAQHEPAAALDPIPAAWYTAMLAESDYKDCSAAAKDPQGKFYNFVFEIADGPYKGRKVYQNYNVVNINQQAVDIAFKDLSAFYHAIGAETENITSTEQLHNRPLEIKVGINAARGDYDASNTIKSGGYRKVGAGASSVPAAGVPPVAPAVPPAVGAVPPVAPAAPAAVPPVVPAAPVAAPPVAAPPPAPVAPVEAAAPTAPAAPPVAPPAPPAAPAAPVDAAPVAPVAQAATAPPPTPPAAPVEAAPPAAPVAPPAAPVAEGAAPAAPWEEPAA